MNWTKKIPLPIWAFSGIWFLLGCIQAATMDLHPDEAYYWQMSRILDWGYFHQPPMIAVFIRTGYALLQNELGVRWLTVLASTASIPMLFELSGTRNCRVFILVFLGMVLTHAAVFMAVPDSPLIFFSLVFLMLLRNYLQQDSWRTAILLGLVAAALMYSKYHAVILFGSVLLAVPKLMVRRSFWITVLLAVLLFLPHILWQLDHDLVSVKYHWLIRHKASWTPLLVLNYVGSELILIGPVGTVLLLAIDRVRPFASAFDRAMLFVLFGFFAFFLFISFKGRVEANWTATAFLPLIILGTRSVAQRPELIRVLQPVALVCAGLLFIARIYIASPWAGKGLHLSFPATGWNAWADSVAQKAEGLPVVFVSSYQLPSQYTFYSGQQGYQFSSINYDGSQFELWDMDSVLEGRPYVFAIPYGDNWSKAVQAEGFPPIYLWEMQEYHSFRRLRFQFADEVVVSKKDSVVRLQGLALNRMSIPVQLDSLLRLRPLRYMVYANGRDTVFADIRCQGCEGTLAPGQGRSVTFVFKAPKLDGKALVRFGLHVKLGLVEQNSDYIQLQTE